MGSGMRFPSPPMVHWFQSPQGHSKEQNDLGKATWASRWIMGQKGLDEHWEFYWKVHIRWSKVFRSSGKKSRLDLGRIGLLWRTPTAHRFGLGADPHPLEIGLLENSILFPYMSSHEASHDPMSPATQQKGDLRWVHSWNGWCRSRGWWSTRLWKWWIGSEFIETSVYSFR